MSKKKKILQTVKRVLAAAGRGLALVGKFISFPLVFPARVLYRGLRKLKRHHLRYIVPALALISLFSFLAFLYLGPADSPTALDAEEAERAEEKVVIVEEIDAEEVVEEYAEPVVPHDDTELGPEEEAFVLPPLEDEPIPVFSLEDLMAPIVGEIITPFGWHYHPIFQDWRFHRGIDIKTQEGTPVRAVWQGRVVDIREDDYLGTVVVLEHTDELHTVYGQLQRVNQQVGGRVKRGETLGMVGNSVLGKEAHLHFELHRRGVPIDPGPYYQGWRGGQ